MIRILLMMIVVVIIQTSSLSANNADTNVIPGVTGTITIDTPNGRMTGVRIDLSLLNNSLFVGKADAFIGIRYAEPPIGNLRFQVGSFQ